MKTIFLAAGKSNRVKPLADKNLLKFCGKPLILQLLLNAQIGGLQDFIIVCNSENKDTIKTLLQTHNFSAKITVQKNLEEGMAGGVLAGLELVNDDEDVFILGGNDFVNPTIYKDIVKKSANFSGGILAKRVDHYFPGGYLEIDRNNIIQSIIEKPGAGNEPSNFVNIVAHYFKTAQNIKSEITKHLHHGQDAYEQSLQHLFSAEKFLAVEYNDNWQAIKYPWHVLSMQEQILGRVSGQNIQKSAEISDKAELIGDHIFIDEGVKIMNGATIVGPCSIGKNTIIGQNCLIRGSNIGENCVIGFCSEICRSFLADNVSTHHAYIGDSVVDEHVNFGAFSCTTNLRLDKNTIKMKIKDELLDSGLQKLGAVIGQGSQIGSGAKILPGRKLQPDTHLGPNEVYKG